jgi:hypothetical protein
VWQFFREVIRIGGRPVPLIVCAAPSVFDPSRQETGVDPQSQLSPDALLERLRSQLEQVLRGVADAVNQAPPGQIINASEEKVRDLFADFRQLAYQTALQMRIDAAEAAFPPSETSPDRQTAAQQGT